MMDMNTYATLIGKLIINFQSLEIAIRLFLAGGTVVPDPAQKGVDLHRLRPGDVVDEDAITNWDSLGQLIAKYNAVPGVVRVDPVVVDVRDAIAHGRLVAAVEAPPLRLVKFDKPVGGRTRVTWSEEISEGWLDNQVKRVVAELTKVARAMADIVPADRG